MRIRYTARGVAEGDGRQGKGYTDDGRLSVDLSAPKALGGDDGPGTNPEQLFAVGYAACFHSALKWAAREAGADATSSSVTGEVGIGLTDDGFALAVTLHIAIPNADRETAEDIAARAHQRCPYSRATRGNIEVAFKINEPG